MSDTLDRLSKLMEGFRTAPVEPIPGYTAKPKGHVMLPSPSRLGKNPLVLQLYRLGFTYPEPLTAFSYLNINRGLTLEVPVLTLLQSILPDSKIQVRLEQDGIKGYADLITKDNEVLDVKCSNTHTWHSNSAYRNQLVWYSQVVNGCNMDAYLLNYTGDIELKVIKAASMARTWLVLSQTIREVMNVSVIHDVISLDNIHWVKLPSKLTADRAWQVNGLKPYYRHLYSDSRKVTPEKAIENIRRDFND